MWAHDHNALLKNDTASNKGMVDTVKHAIKNNSTADMKCTFTSCMSKCKPNKLLQLQLKTKTTNSKESSNEI